MPEAHKIVRKSLMIKHSLDWDKIQFAGLNKIKLKLTSDIIGD